LFLSIIKLGFQCQLFRLCASEVKK
jgi:hypothetical protein